MRLDLIVNSILLLLLFISCNNSKSELLQLIEERDSLYKEVSLKNSALANYNETLELMNSTLDSIAYQEGIVFVGKGDQAPTREDVKENLLKFETLIKNQQNKISELEKKILSQQDSLSQTFRVIAHLKVQVESKSEQIEQLKEVIEQKNISIAKLLELVDFQNMKIENQAVTINELNKRTRRQNDVLAAQDAILNNGYVLIGSKSDLKRRGITSRGKLVSKAVLDRSKFFKVDIRKWREFTFKARRPKILTNMPSDSYELTTSGDKIFKLKITNVSNFWRISNYLVIQTD